MPPEVQDGKKAVAAHPVEKPDGHDAAAKPAAAGLDQTSHATVAAVTRGERDATANDQAVKQTGFTPAGDILPAADGARTAEKLPTAKDEDGSTSVIRPDNKVVTSEKPNPWGEVPRITVAQGNSDGEASRIDSYHMIKGDLLRSSYERDGNGQWSSVDYNGTRAPAVMTDLGDGRVSLKPAGALSGSEQVAAYQKKLFDAAKAPAPNVEEAAKAQEQAIRSIVMDSARAAQRSTMPLEHADGSTYTPGRNGSGMLTAKDGRVTETKSTADVYTSYGYGAAGDLKSVDTFEASKNGTGVTQTQYLKEADGSWSSVKADGTKTPSQRSFSVESDGSLTVNENGKSKSITLDGKERLSGLPPERLVATASPERASEQAAPRLDEAGLRDLMKTNPSALLDLAKQQGGVLKIGDVSIPITDKLVGDVPSNVWQGDKSYTQADVLQTVFNRYDSYAKNFKSATELVENNGHQVYKFPDKFDAARNGDVAGQLARDAAKVMGKPLVVELGGELLNVKPGMSGKEFSRERDNAWQTDKIVSDRMGDAIKSARDGKMDYASMQTFRDQMSAITQRYKPEFVPKEVWEQHVWDKMPTAVQTKIAASQNGESGTFKPSERTATFSSVSGEPDAKREQLERMAEKLPDILERGDREVVKWISDFAVASNKPGQNVDVSQMFKQLEAYGLKQGFNLDDPLPTAKTTSAQTEFAVQSMLRGMVSGRIDPGMAGALNEYDRLVQVQAAPLGNWDGFKSSETAESTAAATTATETALSRQLAERAHPQLLEGASEQARAEAQRRIADAGLDAKGKGKFWEKLGQKPPKGAALLTAVGIALAAVRSAGAHELEPPEQTTFKP